MNEITFDILKIVVSVCAALTTVYLVPYIKTLKDDKRYEALADMIIVAVRAAEQTIGSGQGAIKKSEVLGIMDRWMEEHGIVVTEDQLDQLIECAVFQMKQET
jgi:LL-H family phage holin